MTFGLYTNSVSAHQLPFAREIVRRVGVDNFRYIYTGVTQGGAQDITSNEPWIQTIAPPTSSCWLSNCNVLLSGIRDIDLFESRCRRGLTTLYMSERWFKPIEVGGGRLKIGLFKFLLPGKWKMLFPAYRHAAKRFVTWLKNDPKAHYLAIGPWARRDMMSLGVPPSKIVDWGYFVQGETSKDESFSTQPPPQSLSSPSDVARAHNLRILWVGRMLELKRVDTIIRAVAAANGAVRDGRGNVERRKFSLTLVGDGPARQKLEKLIHNLVDRKSLTFGQPSSAFKLHSAVSLSEVRSLMRAHDLYIFSSNALDGWGAVVSEALTEGMTVLGTYETGASAALLPKENLFHVGDWRTLARMLLEKSYRPTTLPPGYTPKGAAERLLNDIIRTNEK